MKTVYLIDPVSRLFIGTYDAQESPLEPGVYIVPTYSTPVPVPDLAEGETARLGEDGETWEVIPAPAPIVPEAPAPTPAEQIVAIEVANPITHRNLRDLSLAVAELIKDVKGIDPAAIPGVAKLMEIETEIAALRAQI